MRHWHRCHRWNRLGMACPMFGFEQDHDSREPVADPEVEIDPPDHRPPREVATPPPVVPVPTPFFLPPTPESREDMEVVEQALEDFENPTVAADLADDEPVEPTGRLRVPPGISNLLIGDEDDREPPPPELSSATGFVDDTLFDSKPFFARPEPAKPSPFETSVAEILREGTGMALEIQPTPIIHHVKQPMPQRLTPATGFVDDTLFDSPPFKAAAERSEIAFTDTLEEMMIRPRAEKPSGARRGITNAPRPVQGPGGSGNRPGGAKVFRTIFTSKIINAGRPFGF